MGTAQLDAIARRRLMLVKQLYQRAVLEAERTTSSVSQILAVIGFDLALETALKAVVSSLQASAQPKAEFQPLLNQSDDVLARAGLGEIPDRGRILHVHGIRNDAQHKARYPPPQEVGDCRTYTRDALDALMNLVWGTSLGALSLSDFVGHEKVRSTLKKAEHALARGDRQEAAELAAVALERTLLHVRRVLVGRNPSRAPSDQAMSNELLGAFVRMQDVLLLTALGIRYADYTRFQDIAGYVDFAGGEALPSQARENPTLDEAEFAVSFATETIIQIEGEAGDLQAPFGWEFLVGERDPQLEELEALEE